MDGKESTAEIDIELSGRPNKTFSSSSTPSKPNLRRPSKSMMFKKFEILRCLFYLLLILALYKSSYAAEPFDPTELDIVLAYMLLQHSAEPYFDGEIENYAIVSLHPQPIHLTLRIRYNEDNGIRSNDEDELHFPCQESGLITQHRHTILAENEAPNNENVSGLNLGHIGQNKDYPDYEVNAGIMEISDTLCSRGNDSFNDLIEEVTSQISEDNGRLQPNIWTNETHADDKISDTLCLRENDSMNDLNDDSTSQVYSIQEANERLSQNIWTNEFHAEYEISGIRNIRNRARVSFEERLCSNDNTQEERVFAQADFLTNDIFSTSEIAGKGMNTYEDSGGGNIRDSGNRDIHESTKTLADDGEDELAIANGPEEKIYEFQDNSEEQRIANTSLRQDRTIIPFLSVDIGEEINLDNKPLDKENDPLILEEQYYMDQKGLSKD